jgi:hypothetical protein
VSACIVLVLIAGAGAGLLIRGRLDRAEGDYLDARAARQFAEAAVVEYIDGGYKQELEELRAQVARTLAERLQAETKAARSARVADRIELQKKVFAYEQAQTKLDVLEKYTRLKTIKKLQNTVAKARSLELARKAVYERLLRPRSWMPW